MASWIKLVSCPQTRSCLEPHYVIIVNLPKMNTANTGLGQLQSPTGSKLLQVGANSQQIVSSSPQGNYKSSTGLARAARYGRSRYLVGGAKGLPAPGILNPHAQQPLQELPHIHWWIQGFKIPSKGKPLSSTPEKLVILPHPDLALPQLQLGCVPFGMAGCTIPGIRVRSHLLSLIIIWMSASGLYVTENWNRLARFWNPHS